MVEKKKNHQQKNNFSCRHNDGKAYLELDLSLFCHRLHSWPAIDDKETQNVHCELARPRRLPPGTNLEPSHCYRAQYAASEPVTTTRKRIKDIQLAALQNKR